MKTFLEATEDFLRMAKRPQTVRQIYDGIADDRMQCKDLGSRHRRSGYYEPQASVYSKNRFLDDGGSARKT